MPVVLLCSRNGTFRNWSVCSWGPSRGWVGALLSLPPLESLRFFEAAARHKSFARAAAELGVTAAAVAHRVRTLESYVGAPLFERRGRGVVLNPRGQSFLDDVQRILADVSAASDRHRGEPRRVRVVSVESVAEKWLVPRLPALQTALPGIAIELETNHRGVDPHGRDFDIWIAYAGQTAAPRPELRRANTLFEEALFEEQLLPVCSPAFLAERGRPVDSAELLDWPMLFDLGWDTDWAYWSACQNQPVPDLSQSSGFRLYSMVVDAAVRGLGVAIGRSVLIEKELAAGSLVPVLDKQADAPERCCIIYTSASKKRPEVQALCEWILQQARPSAQPAPGQIRRKP